MDWLEDVKAHAPDDAVVFLIGNKSDLESKVSPEAVKTLMDREPRIKRHFLTSAYSGDNVNHAFDDLIAETAEVCLSDLVEPKSHGPVHLNSYGSTSASMPQNNGCCT